MEVRWGTLVQREITDDRRYGKAKLGDMPRQARLDERRGPVVVGRRIFMSGGGAEVWIHWGVGGAVSGDDNIIGELVVRLQEMTELDTWDR